MEPPACSLMLTVSAADIPKQAMCAEPPKKEPSMVLRTNFFRQPSEFSQWPEREGGHATELERGLEPDDGFAADDKR
jgi:hypothetical protein